MANDSNVKLYCASDVLLKNDSVQFQAMEHLDIALKKQKSNEGNAETNNSFILPLAVHIIHLNGLENISDQQIQTALLHLNQAFSNSGYFGQNGQGADTQIRFCIAQQDPNGVASNGITRHVSPLTDVVIENTDAAVKNTVHWNAMEYINIWVVRSIESQSSGSGVAGYAYFPSAHGTALDGIVIESDFFGKSPAKSSVLIHEMGHYLGLYHTFEGGCKNDDCLLDGDRVCDTPPDAAQHTGCSFNSCQTDADAAFPNPFLTDTDDATDNFMDYSPLDCYRNFTQGQAERMQAVLLNVRSSLLESKGCQPPCTTPIFADFSPKNSTIDVGASILYENQSMGASDFEWQIDGTAFSNSQNFTFTFQNEGNFLVKLLARNDDLNCLDSLQSSVRVICPTEAFFSLNRDQWNNGDSIFGQNQSTNANEFEWFLNGNLISNEQDIPMIIATTGEHILTLSASNGLCEKQFSQNFEVLPDCQGGLCPELCYNGLDDDGDGFVDCYDTDCQCFTGDNCSVSSVPNNFTMQLAWQSQQNRVAVNSVPMVANLNPQSDSIPEIIVLSSPSQVSSMPGTEVLIFKGNGQNAGVPDVLPIPNGFDAYPMTHPAVSDVDADGIPELIMVEYDGRIRVYKDFQPNQTPCMTLWLVSDEDAWSRNARPSLADFDGDGTPEIYTGNSIFRFDLSDINAPRLEKVLQGNGASGQLIYRDFQENATLSAAADVLSVGDCNGDPDCEGLELVAGYMIYSVDLDGTDGDGFQIKVKKNLRDLHPANGWKDGYTAVADVDLDGTPDVVVSSGKGNRYGIYVWNKNGLVRFMPFENDSPLSGSIPCIANVFDDKSEGFSLDFPEIIACNHKQLTCFNLNAASQNPGSPHWWRLATTDASGLTGSSVFDFNGDGLFEIVYRDEDHLRILYGGALPLPNGVDSERNWFRYPTGSGTFDEYPVIADVDADGQAEIAVTGYTSSGTASPITDYRGRLRVFENGQIPWVPARAVWNQTNYNIVNIRDDLSIPKQQQKLWLEFPMAGSQNRPFNAHLGQLSVLDEQFQPFYPVPDATVSIVKTNCLGNELEVEFEICNHGSRPLPLSTPMQWYDGNPTQTSATESPYPFFLTKTIEVDSCSFFKQKLPISSNVDLWAVLNDNGTLPIPFNFQTDFPSTLQPECDYENNIAHLHFDYAPIAFSLGNDTSLCSNSVLKITAPQDLDNFRWQDGSTETSYTATAPSMVWLEAEDVCGKTYRDTLILSVNEHLTIDLPQSLERCQGDTLSVSVNETGFQTIDWTPKLGVDCPNCTAVQVKTDSSFTLLAHGKNGACFAIDSVKIIVHPNPNIVLQNDTLACADLDGATITALPSGGTAPYGFQWTSGSQNNQIQATEAGTYSISITDANGCIAHDSVNLKAPTPLLFSVQIDSIDCHDGLGSITLNHISGAQPIQYLWSNGIATPDLISISADTYILEAIDSLQCIFQDTFTLGNPQALSIDYQIDTLDCNKKKGQILSTPSGGTAPYDFLWFNGNTSSILSSTADVFTLTIEDAKGCMFKDTVQFFMDTLPPQTTLQGDSMVIPCTQRETLLSADCSLQNDLQTAWGRIESDSLVWHGEVFKIKAKERGWHFFRAKNLLNGCETIDSIFVYPAPAIDAVSVHRIDVSCPSEMDGALYVNHIVGGENPFQYSLNNGPLQHESSFTNLEQGKYCFFIEDRNGCTWFDTFFIVEPPAFSLFLNADHTQIDRGQAVHIAAEISPKDHPLLDTVWLPKHYFPKQNQWEQVIFPSDSLEIALNIVDSFGCVLQVNQRIDVAQTDIFIPNIFQPESDENAYFTLYSARDVARIDLLEIYDRWGNLVFSKGNFPPNNPFLGWDGLWNGKRAATGVYVLQAKVVLQDGRQRMFKASITLMR